MVLTCPIHVYTPRAYINIIHGSQPSQSVNGLDLFRSLGALTRPLDFHAIYSQQVKAKIEVAFTHRTGRSIPSPHCIIYIFFLPLRSPRFVMYDIWRSLWWWFRYYIIFSLFSLGRIWRRFCPGTSIGSWVIVSWKAARGQNNIPFDGGDKHDQTLSSKLWWPRSTLDNCTVHTYSQDMTINWTIAIIKCMWLSALHLYSTKPNAQIILPL